MRSVTRILFSLCGQRDSHPLQAPPFWLLLTSGSHIPQGYQWRSPWLVRDDTVPARRGTARVRMTELPKEHHRPARPDLHAPAGDRLRRQGRPIHGRSEEHTSELQSQFHLVCRLLLEKKKKTKFNLLITTKKKKKKIKINK